MMESTVLGQRKTGMEAQIRIRADLNGDVTDVQALIKHPMDSGFAKDETGQPIAPRYIETLAFEHCGRTVFTANWGPMIAKDPYIRFFFKGGAIGDPVTIRWTDSGKSHAALTIQIEAGQNSG